MAGIYVHIPFCKKKCHYCDFYSTSNKELTEQFIFALNKEIELRSDYPGGEIIGSIYFGGGSPSMLSVEQIQSILGKIKDHFEISSDAEITFECNPDDLYAEYCRDIKDLGINRLSIGIQSFNDDVLKFLNRRHSSQKGEEAINMAKEIFKNISIDLMFGIPGMDSQIYNQTLNKALDFKVNHISAYHLSIEPGTLLYKKLKKGDINIIDEDISLYQFDLTINKLKEQGYKHYEVSNYALVNHESKHNWLYWSNGKYLGLGPSAHSYNGNSRQWNISNTRNYIDLINSSRDFYEKEELSIEDKFNEYVLTSLRTCSGVSTEYVKQVFNEKIFSYFIKKLDTFVHAGYIEDIGGKWVLNKKGLFILDLILEKFYYL